VKRLLALLTFAASLIGSYAHAAIAYVGTGAVTSTSSTTSFAIPSGSVGDLIICEAAHYNPNYTLPTPSAAAYTELASGSTYIFHKIWARIATGSDTFTLTSPSGYLTGSCSRFSGTSTDLSTIVDVAGIKRTTLTAVRVAAMTPTHDNELLFYSLRAKAPGTGTSLAVPTGMTELRDTYYSAPDLLTSAGYSIQTTATAISQQDIAITPTPGTAQSNTAIMLALQPSGTGGGGGGGVWSLVGYGTAVGVNSGAASPALPAGHAAGDWLCWYGRERNTANTLAQPAGYTQVVASQVSGHDVMSLNCKIDSGSESAPSTTFVGVGQAQMVAFRGGPASISGINATNTTSNSCTTSPPQPSLTITSYGTLVMSFSSLAALYGTYDPNTVAPAGFATGAANVSIDQYSGSSDETLLFSYYIYPLNSTLASGTYTVTNASSVACRGIAAAVISSSVAPTITDVNTTNTFTATATGLVITGTGFGASQGTGGVVVVDGSTTCTETVTAWADTSITFSAVLGNCRYGARSVRVTTNGGTSASKDVTVTAPSGKCYFDLGTLLQPFQVDKYGAPNRFGDFSPNDMTDNSQMEFSSLVFTGSSTCANITVNSDGSYKVPEDLFSLSWQWNPGGSGQSWHSSGTTRTGQNKVHIKPVNGFRLSCSNTTAPNTGIPTRGTPNKTICLSGCDYPNTTVGIQQCMAAISPGQVCEMRSSTSDGSTETWAAQIRLVGVAGTSGSPKTLWVRDPDSIMLEVANPNGGMLEVLSSSYVNIQGNTTATSGLIIGDQSLWAVNCALSASSPSFSGTPNCYPHKFAIYVGASNDVGLFNLTSHGGSDNNANYIDNASNYVYIRQSDFNLHGINNNQAPTAPSDSGVLLQSNGDHVLVEDTTFAHSGASAIKVTGSFNIFRRITVDNYWQDLTSNATYTGSQLVRAVSNDCSSAGFGCSPYGPILFEDSEFKRSGLTPTHPTSNYAVSLLSLGGIFRKNYVHSNYHNYLLTMCDTEDHVTTTYREGEQAVYNNTFFGGAPILMPVGGYPASISGSECQNMIIADNLFQGAQPGPNGGAYIYAFTALLGTLSVGSYSNSWKGTRVFANIFGIDPAAPSLNMQVNLTGTGAATKSLTDSSTWPSNFYSNTSVTQSWANGSTTPSLDRAGLILGTTSASGLSDATPIAVTTNSGAPSASMTLNSARPFKDDWGFSTHTFGSFHTEYGDCLVVGPLTTSTFQQGVAVRIAASGINYTTNTVTLANSVSFQTGSPVWKGIDNLDGTCGRAWGNRGAAQ
jgi:hypothetical protein